MIVNVSLPSNFPLTIINYHVLSSVWSNRNNCHHDHGNRNNCHHYREKSVIVDDSAHDSQLRVRILTTIIIINNRAPFDQGLNLLMNFHSLIMENAPKHVLNIQSLYFIAELHVP